MLMMLLLIFCRHCAAFPLPTVHDFHFLVLYLIWRLCLIFPSQVATGTGAPAPNVRFYDVLMCAKEPLAFFKLNRKRFVFLHARTPARVPVRPSGGCMAPTRKKIEGQEENYDLISQSSHTVFSILKTKNSFRNTHNNLQAKLNKNN